VTVPSQAAAHDASWPVSRLPSPGVRAFPANVIVIPGRGLQLPRQLSFDRWLSVGRRLSDISSSSAWCLGDWLVYGEVAFDGRYRDAIEQTALDYQTLRNYAWVVRRFCLSRRRDSLSFGHHAEVAALPEVEQDFWLGKAEEFGWSAKRLRREVRASLSERSASGSPSRPGDSRPDCRADETQAMACLQIRLTSEQMHACRAAASRAGVTVQAWAVQSLDQAARHAYEHNNGFPICLLDGTCLAGQAWLLHRRLYRPKRKDLPMAARPGVGVDKADERMSYPFQDKRILFGAGEKDAALQRGFKLATERL